MNKFILRKDRKDINYTSPTVGDEGFNNLDLSFNNLNGVSNKNDISNYFINYFNTLKYYNITIQSKNKYKEYINSCVIWFINDKVLIKYNDNEYEDDDYYFFLSILKDDSPDGLYIELNKDFIDIYINKVDFKKEFIIEELEQRIKFLEDKINKIDKILKI